MATGLLGMQSLTAVRRCACSRCLMTVLHLNESCLTTKRNAGCSRSICQCVVNASMLFVMGTRAWAQHFPSHRKKPIRTHVRTGSFWYNTCAGWHGSNDHSHASKKHSD